MIWKRKLLSSAWVYTKLPSHCFYNFDLIEVGSSKESFDCTWYLSEKLCGQPRLNSFMALCKPSIICLCERIPSALWGSSGLLSNQLSTSLLSLNSSLEFSSKLKWKFQLLDHNNSSLPRCLKVPIIHIFSLRTKGFDKNNVPAVPRLAYYRTILMSDWIHKVSWIEALVIIR